MVRNPESGRELHDTRARDFADAREIFHAVVILATLDLFTVNDSDGFIGVDLGVGCSGRQNDQKAVKLVQTNPPYLSRAQF